MSERGRDRYSRARYGSGRSNEASVRQTHESASEISEEGKKYSRAAVERRLAAEKAEKTARAANKTAETDSPVEPDNFTSADNPSNHADPAATMPLSDPPNSDQASTANPANPPDHADPANPDSSRTNSSRKTTHASLNRARAIKIAVIAVVAVALIGAIAAYAYVSNVTGKLHEGVDDDLRNALVETDMAHEPFYMLLLGTDGSAEREADPEFGGVYRTDSMMLARIDPVGKKVTLVSIPRDLVVDLGKDGEQKINAAYAVGGAARAVEAVSNLADVPISHYASVDFDGFAAMVDALGGIEVEVPMEIDDWEAGGYVPGGLQTLDGAQALILCRARTAYADISAHPDEMRTANQRLVLSAIAKKLLSSDIATIASTVSAMAEYVTTDLEVNDIIGLAQGMRGLNPESDIYTGSVPTRSEYIADVWNEYLMKAEWRDMMKRVKAGEAPNEEAIVDEATGTVLATSGVRTVSTAAKYATVTVKNATEISGLAATTRSKLMDAGFVNVVIGEITDNFSYPQTLVVYDEPGRAREAEEIVQVIGQGETMLNDGSYLLLDSDFMVVLGDNWQE